MSNTFSRRHFLQYGMAAIAGGTALGVCRSMRLRLPPERPLPKTIW